jgi:hypothetical protein
MGWKVTGGHRVDKHPDEDGGAAYKLHLQQLGYYGESTIVFFDREMCSKSAAIAAISEHLNSDGPPRRVFVDRQGNASITEPSSASNR